MFARVSSPFHYEWTELKEKHVQPSLESVTNALIFDQFKQNLGDSQCFT